MSLAQQDELKKHLSQLRLGLEVFAVSGQSSEVQEGEDEVHDEVIFATDIDMSTDPFIVVRSADDSEDGQPAVLALWETQITLHRPRARISPPLIILRPNAGLTTQNVELQSDAAKYLQSFEAASYNVFEPLVESFHASSKIPYLPVSRLEKVLPASLVEERGLHIKHHKPTLFRVTAPVTAHIRFSRLQQPRVTAETMGSLDFEVLPSVGHGVHLTKVSAVLSEGTSRALSCVELPLLCHSKDIVTTLYRFALSSDRTVTNETTTIRLSTPVNRSCILSILIVSVVEVSPICRPEISMSWNTTVDFSSPLNPSFGLTTQPMQRNNRPSSLAIGRQSGMTTPNNERSSTISTTRGHVTISFSGPAHPVEVGRVFTWQVVVVNHGSQPVKLVIVPLSRIQRNNTVSQSWQRRHAPKPSTSSVYRVEQSQSIRLPRTQDGKPADVAQAIADENIIYALQRQANQLGGDFTSEVVSLSTDIRVGPLAGGTCHETEIKILALKAGSLQFDAVRVVDLIRESEEGTGKGVVDITDLPDIVATTSEEVSSDV